MSLSVFTTILAIRLLGDEGYGYVVLISTVTMLWVMLNNGFYTVLVRRIIFICADDISALREMILLGLVYTGLSALIFLFIALTSENELMEKVILGSSSNKTSGELSIAFKYALTLIVARLFVLYSLALFEGVGRFSTAAKIQLTSPVILLLGLLIMPQLLEGGLTVKMYFQIFLASLVCELLVSTTMLLISEWPADTGKTSVSRMVGRLPELIGESIRLQLSNIFSMFVDPLNKLVINHFIGVSQVTSYELVSKIIIAVRGVFSAAFRAFLQLAPDKTLASVQYKKVIIYIFLPSIILHMVVFLLFLYGINSGALGVSHQSVQLMLVMLIPSIAIVLVAPLYSLLIGAGDYKYILVLHARLAVLNSIVSVLLVPLIGIIGAGIGVSVATIYNGFSVYRRFEMKYGKLGGVFNLVKRSDNNAVVVFTIFIITWLALLLIPPEDSYLYFCIASLGVLLLFWRLWREPLTSGVLRKINILGSKL
ncbi:hypothetical protein [Thiogranum longum]|nr:hypothetical protein [Thiogranum longum]